MHALNISREASLPVVVEFYAAWCPKCAMMQDAVRQLTEKYRGSIRFEQVDIDRRPDIAAKTGVDIVPTFVVCQDGEIIGYTTGLLPASVLERRILQMLEDAASNH